MLVFVDVCCYLIIFVIMFCYLLLLVGSCRSLLIFVAICGMCGYTGSFAGGLCTFFLQTLKFAAAHFCGLPRGRICFVGGRIVFNFVNYGYLWLHGVCRGLSLRVAV